MPCELSPNSFYNQLFFLVIDLVGDLNNDIYFLSRAAAPVAAAGPSEADMKKLTAMVSPNPM